MRASSPRSGPQSGPLPAVPQVSIGSWAFAFGPYENDPWPFERVCDFAAKVGYDGVEINGFRPHPHYDDFIGGKGAKELKVQISEHDLGISAYAPDCTCLAASTNCIDGARIVGNSGAHRFFGRRTQLLQGVGR